MTRPNLLVATSSDGVLTFFGDEHGRELAGRSVRALAEDNRGMPLAIVDGRSVCRRNYDGAWKTIATSDVDLACIAATGAAIYLGTDDARVLTLTPDGRVTPLEGFNSVPGRANWYAGTALINGHLVGPPLGIRSMAVTSSGEVLLANVHVGGIPRSTDEGRTWEATIEIDSDVHEVRTHPFRPNVAAAAAAVGLCITRNAGFTWAVETEGLHATYCSAVAFAENDIFVAASTDHFATHGAVYRRPVDGAHALERVDGLPEWLDGIVDTGCLASRGSVLAVADQGGHLYESTDGGRSWRERARGLPHMSAVLAVR